MVNRSIQQKILKMKRRNRYVRLSGGQSKLTAVSEEFQGKDGKYHRIAVGKVSFSRQVINTGGGANNERMAQYFDAVRADNFFEVIPDAIPLTEPVKEMAKRYFTIIRETPRENRITIFQDRLGRIDLFYRGETCFFIELDFVTGECRRSRDYDKRRSAIDRYNNNRITWVEFLTP